MKIYTGWILRLDGVEHTVIGSMNIRGTHRYILKDAHGEKVSIKRDDLLSLMHSKKAEYIRSVAI